MNLWAKAPGGGGETLGGAPQRVPEVSRFLRIYAVLHVVSMFVSLGLFVAAGIVLLLDRDALSGTAMTLLGIGIGLLWARIILGAVVRRLVRRRGEVPSDGSDAG